jgi:hypothetical protein
MCDTTTTQIRPVEFSPVENSSHSDKVEVPFVAEHESGAKLAALVVVAAFFTSVLAGGFLVAGLA